MEVRRQWADIIKVLNLKKKQTCQPRILYLASCPSKLREKLFPGKQKLRAFVVPRPALEEMLKGVLQLMDTRKGLKNV